MGNAVQKKYDIPTEHCASAGLCQLYKIYNGVTKEPPIKEISVWNIAKDAFAKRKPAITDKSTLEQLYSILKKDIQSMKVDPKDAKDPKNDCNSLLKIIEVKEFIRFVIQLHD